MPRVSLSITALGLLLGSTAWSQSSDKPERAAADAGGLEEIVVTAQKQTQSLQKTSAAVTAISSELLVQAGVTDLRAAQMLAPSVRFQAENNNTQVFIRGVGSNLDFPNVEASVAFIYNGSYLPREGTSAALFDLEQIEVLPGPQGTLYGRSAVGGAVVISPRRPEQNTEGSALLEVGNYSMVHATYAQNVPVTDTFALRGAVDYVRHDGYNESGADAKSDYAVRLSGLYEPNDDVSLFLWSHYAEKGGHPANLVNKGTDPATGAYREDAFLRPDPWDDTRTGPLAPLAVFGNPVADEQQYETFMIGGQLDWRFGDVTLSYLPSYFYLDSAPDYWLGTLRARLTAHYNQIANEFRVARSDHEKLDWLAGLYLYRVRNDGELILLTNQPFSFRQSNIDFNQIENIAAFGQVTIKTSDDLRFIVGGRYSVDKREAFGIAPDPVGAGPWAFNRKFTNFDWKAGVEYDVGGRSLLYGSVQTGYKPGSYNEVPSTPTFDNLVRPSELLAYTAGYKTRLLDNRLQVNTEVFFYDYEDFAIQAYDIAAPFNPVFNAQKLEIYGTQIDLLWAVADEASLKINVGYARARNKEFVTPAGDDFTDFQPPYAPDWTVLGSYSHGFRVGSGLLRARLDARFESSWYADYVHNQGVRQDSSWKADASFTYEAEGGWTLGAWIKNIDNEAVIAATAAAGIPGPATAYLESPRTFGLRATYNF
jgi:iron complex outermembrane recepter protein